MDDAGVAIAPLLHDRQIFGRTAQGAGQAPVADLVYDNEVD